MRSSKHRSHRRIGLRLEQLECRSLMAGDVLAEVVRGQLRLTGDTADNAVQIATTANPGEIVVTGLSGTTINGATSSNATTATLTGVTGNIVANLGAGQDSLTVNNATLPRGLIVSDNAGATNVSISNSTIASDVAILASGGGATINLTDSTFGALAVVTGQATDQVTLDSVTVNRTSTINTGLGDDTITLTDSTLSKGLLMNTGPVLPTFASRLLGRPTLPDADTVTVNNTNVGGPVMINLADGADQFTMTGGGFSGIVDINAGAGDDTVTITGGSWTGYGGGITAGDGTNTINITGLNVTRGLGVLGGKGTDTVTLSGVIAGGLVTVDTLGGADNVAVIDSIFSGNTLFTLGEGDDALTFTNSQLKGRQNQISGGRGTDSLTRTTTTFTAAPTIRDVENLL